MSRGIRSFASLVALVGVTAGLAGCGPKPKGSYPEDDPRSAVHQLLRATVGQANGQRACALLTEAARERFDRTAAGSCRNALNTAIAALPGTYARIPCHMGSTPAGSASKRTTAEASV